MSLSLTDVAAADKSSSGLFAKVQSFIVLLNRQRVERTLHSASTSSPSSMPAMNQVSSFPPSTTYYSHDQQFLHPAPIRGRALVVNSSIQLLQTFLFFYHREPAVLICWTLGQQAFNACMILILDAWETYNDQNEWLVNQAFVVFTLLDRCGVHPLAGLAVRRISEGLAQLGMRKQAAETAHTQLQRQTSQQGMETPLPPDLTLDTSTLTNLAGDTLMGNTGMFLLEDSGLQAYVPSSFQPLAWNIAASGGGQSASSAHPSNPSQPPSPVIPTPSVPVSNVTVAPFPVMSQSYLPNTIPVTNSPYAVGLQPRMPNLPRHGVSRRPNTASQTRSTVRLSSHGQLIEDVGFATVNTLAMHTSDPQRPSPRQRYSSQDLAVAIPAGEATLGAARGDAFGARRLDRIPRNQQRRSGHGGR